MAARAMLVAAGIAILGVVLLAVGWFIEPNSNVARPGTLGTFPGASITDNLGVALIALGLTLLLVGLGFFFAWAAERTMAEATI